MNILKLTIDRFEGTFVVCELVNGNFVNLPKDVLSPEVAEGYRLVLI